MFALLFLVLQTQPMTMQPMTMTVQTHGQHILTAALVFQALEFGRFVPVAGKPLDKYSYALENGSRQIVEQVQTLLLPSLRDLDTASTESAHDKATENVRVAAASLRATLTGIPIDEWNERGYVTYISAALTAIESGVRQ
jgi:hypothetical protein